MGCKEWSYSPGVSRSEVAWRISSEKASEASRFLCSRDRVSEKVVFSVLTLWLCIASHYRAMCLWGNGVGFRVSFSQFKVRHFLSGGEI